MRKREGKSIFVVSLLVLVLLVGIVYSTVFDVRDKMTQYCFQELALTSRRLADDLNSSMKKDQVLLSALAELIASKDNPTDAEIDEIMNSYNMIDSYVNYLAILKPDNTYLHQDGRRVTGTGENTFLEQIKKGSYISGVWRNSEPLCTWSSCSTQWCPYSKKW